VIVSPDSLSWLQVNAWRMARQSLSTRLQRPDLLQAVKCTGGVQGQVMSAAEWALGTRLEDLTRSDVQSALWQERSLVKTWAMRATLHLLAAEDLPLYTAARRYDTLNFVRYFDYYGINKSQYEAYLAAAPQVLGGQPMTRGQLAAAVADRTGIPQLRELVESKGWGTPLKPLAWHGDLCFGPSQGQNVTFVNPHRWLGEWQPVEPFMALQEMARRYLGSFGPANAENFSLWWGGGSSLVLARKVFKSLADELAPVEVEGWKALALRSSLDAMHAARPSGSVRLLPLFDAYTMGIGRGAEIEPILPAAFQRRVYRPQGWISAVVLLDGCMLGTWETVNKGAQTILHVHLFAPPPPSIVPAIQSEVERMAAFFNSKIILEFDS
jgi:hypothetical protein